LIRNGFRSEIAHLLKILASKGCIKRECVN
jgi:hypothetical protein